MGITLNRTTRESGSCYAAALVEACQTAGVADPVKVLTDTDDYPQVVRDVAMAEFLVGWFHGVADSLGLQIEALWEAVAPAAEPPKPRKKASAKRKPRAKAKPKAPAPTPAPAPEPAPVAKAPAKAPQTDAQAVSEAMKGAPEDVAARAKAAIEALRARRNEAQAGAVT